MKTSRANKGQFSVIAALLVSVILVTAVISTYTMVRNAPLQDSPKVLTAIGEMNMDIKTILDFTVGYYGSILKVTGNSTYARGLTTSYLSSGLVNIARSHPEWNPSFSLNYEQVSTRWFMPRSYSTGNISVTYSLGALGIEGVKYETSSALQVNMLESDVGIAQIRVTRDNTEPELGLCEENFWFYKYNYETSIWTLVHPDDLTISSNGIYSVTLPSGVDQNAYYVQVNDNRGLVVTAFYSQGSVESEIPHYTYTFDWESTGMLDIYESLSTDTFAIEVLQNGTLMWLGQPLELAPQARPIPPISVKALRVNATISGVNQEIPFQVEDWASDYKIPLGLAGNNSIFNNNNMLVFLVNNEISEVTLWWDGNDVATQTSYAWENIYFDDDPDSGNLENGFLHLDVNNFYVFSNVIGEYADYRTDFLRVNDDMPEYGAEPAYVIHNGVVRDIIQQEPEYNYGGVSGSPNFYSQVYLTLPANAPYYTYAVRTIFVDSLQSRTVDDLSVIQLSDIDGTVLTEDGTNGGYPETSTASGRFYDGYPTGDWDHHWSQIRSGNAGAGIMFTDNDNQNLYVFDTSSKRGALNVNSNLVEVNPVDPSLSSISFTNSRDLTWYGAVVTFDGEPIYTSPANGHVGLWVMVENPPAVSLDEYEAETPSPPEGSVITEYVDALSDVDSSPDKGSHSDFPAQQAGPDSVFDTLAEGYTGSGGIEDYVDNNTSDVDASVDIGSHSNFPAQQAGPDSVYDTLTESSGSANSYSLDATGGYMVIGGTPDWGSVTGTISFWIKMDSSIQGRFWGQNDNMETRWSGSNLVLDWGASGSMTSATSFTANKWYFVAIVWNENTDNLLLYVGDSSNAPTLDSNSRIGTWTSTTPSPTQNRFMNGVGSSQPVDGHGDDLRYWAVARSLAEIQSDYNIELTGSESNLRSYFKLNNNYDDIGPANNDGYISGSGSFSTDVAFSGATNYKLDLEVQFTNVDALLPNHELCIYAGSLGSENLKVDYWSGSNWVNLATDLTANSWNNFTVPVASSTFTVRFTGGTETGDASADQWAIDTVLLNNYGYVSNEDAVDSDASNVDSSSDLGTLTNFNSMKTRDSTYATLTETGSGGGITFVNMAEASATSGTSATISKPVGTQQNDLMIALLTSTLGNDNDGTTMSVAPSGWTLEHDYTQNAYSGQHVYVYWKVAGASEPSSYSWSWYQSCGWVAQITTFRGVDTVSPIHSEGTVNQESTSSPMSPSVTTTENNCMVWLYDMCDSDVIPYSGGAPSGTTWIDQTEVNSPGNGVGISTAYFVKASAGATGNKDWYLDSSDENSGQQFALKPASSDYRLDQEVQWTDVPYSLPNEYLSIYGGSMGAEDVAVNVWTGSGWQTVFTDLSSGWNNVSISEWLTSSTFTIRFRDGTTVGDATADTWQIDVALIHVWNEDENYEIDLEVQWTNLDYDEANEELCINVGSVGGENLRVDAWTGSAWETVISALDAGWNNVTISSYLTSSTFTIRFVGTTETGDTTQNYWTIDTTLIRSWT